MTNNETAFINRDQAKWKVLFSTLATPVDAVHHVFVPDWLWPFADSQHVAVEEVRMVFFKSYYPSVLVYPR